VHAREEGAEHGVLSEEMSSSGHVSGSSSKFCPVAAFIVYYCC
jgi:hypothetical protein